MAKKQSETDRTTAEANRLAAERERKRLEEEAKKTTAKKTDTASSVTVPADFIGPVWKGTPEEPVETASANTSTASAGSDKRTQLINGFVNDTIFPWSKKKTAEDKKNIERAKEIYGEIDKLYGAIEATTPAKQEDTQAAYKQIYELANELDYLDYLGGYAEAARKELNLARQIENGVSAPISEEMRALITAGEKAKAYYEKKGITPTEDQLAQTMRSFLQVETDSITARKIGNSVIDAAVKLGKGYLSAPEHIMDFVLLIGGLVPLAAGNDEAVQWIKDFTSRDLIGEAFESGDFLEGIGFNPSNIEETRAAWQDAAKWYKGVQSDSYLEQLEQEDHWLPRIIGGIPESIGGMMFDAGIGRAITEIAKAADVSLKTAQTIYKASSLTSLGLRSAGSAAGEAYNEGASYLQGLGYGALRGAIEMASEGISDFNPFYSGANVARGGLSGVAKGMFGEGMEEVVAGVTDPLTKTIYKGKDALKEYGTPEFWFRDLPSEFAAGALTAAIASGATGQLTPNNLRAGTAVEAVGNADTTIKKIANQWANGKLTDAKYQSAMEAVKQNYAVAEKSLQEMTDKARAKLFEQNPGLKNVFNEDGSIRTEVSARLQDAQETKFTAGEIGNVSPNLRTTQGEQDVRRTIETANNSETLRKNGEQIKVYDRELTTEQRESFKIFANTVTKLNQATGGEIGIVVVESNKGKTTEAFVNKSDNVIYVNVAVMSEAKSVKDLAKLAVHEMTHLTQGDDIQTISSAKLEAAVRATEEFQRVSAELTKRGNDYGFTKKMLDNLEKNARAAQAWGEKESETRKALEAAKEAGDQAEIKKQSKKLADLLQKNLDGKVGKDLSAKEIELEDERYAEATARILSSDNAFINEYVKNPNLAERFLANLEKVGGWFKRMTSKEARTAYKQVQDIKAKFLDALAERGYQYKNGKVTAAVPDEKEKAAEAVDSEVGDSVRFNLAYEERHVQDLAENYDSGAAVSLEVLNKRMKKVVDIWNQIGGELNSQFLNEWNSKKGQDRVFAVFKAQSGYKYNMELSTMCKKGVPLFEAIDTIVRKEIVSQLDSGILGKAEKQILYDILKEHGFEIPCAICYVEQARQREGEIIRSFVNGNEETGKVGWNQTLDKIEEAMKNRGVNYSFKKMSRSIATSTYVEEDVSMDEKTSLAYYESLMEVCNEQIEMVNKDSTDYNKTHTKKKKLRPLVKEATPEGFKKALSGSTPLNLRSYKVLAFEQNSRVKLDADLLYSSISTENLARSHHDLYSLFNSQGGVSTFKTKQTPVIYWGDVLQKKWKRNKLRGETGVRMQSNSDSQMYTIVDKAQMLADLTAKGYFAHEYTKVLAEIKLFGLSNLKVNASVIPGVVYYYTDGTSSRALIQSKEVDVEKTSENLGLDEKGNPIFDNVEGINAEELFAILSYKDYSKSVCGICIGYSDKQILALLNDNRIQMVIGYHDKTNDTTKRYKGAVYAHNYNGQNEAVVIETGETIHVGFSQFLAKSESLFGYDIETEEHDVESVEYHGKKYSFDDVPKLAAQMYLDFCEKKGYYPAYSQCEIDFSKHENYYKLLADFGLYDNEGHYAPQKKVNFQMPNTIPSYDGKTKTVKQVSTKDFIKSELEQEMRTRDSISEALSDESSDGIIPQFVKRVNELRGIPKSQATETESYSDIRFSRAENNSARQNSLENAEDVEYNKDVEQTTEEKLAQKMKHSAEDVSKLFEEWKQEAGEGYPAGSISNRGIIYQEGRKPPQGTLAERAAFLKDGEIRLVPYEGSNNGYYKEVWNSASKTWIPEAEFTLLKKNLPYNPDRYTIMRESLTKVSGNQARVANLINSIADRADTLRALTSREYAILHGVAIAENVRRDVLSNPLFKSLAKQSTAIFYDNRISPRKARESFSKLEAYFNSSENDFNKDYIEYLETFGDKAKDLQEQIEDCFQCLRENIDSKEPLSAKELEAIDLILKFEVRMFQEKSTFFERDYALTGEKYGVKQGELKVIDIQEYAKEAKQKVDNMLLVNKEYGGIKGFFDRIGDRLFDFSAYTSMPLFVAEHLDGNRDGFFTKYERRFVNASKLMYLDRLWLKKQIDDFNKAHKGFADRLRENAVSSHSVEGYDIPLGMAIHIIQQSTQDNGYITLTNQNENEGGIYLVVFAKDEKGKRYIPKAKQRIHFTEQGLAALKDDVLSREGVGEYIDLIDGLIKITGKWQHDTDMDLYGFSNINLESEQKHFPLSRYKQAIRGNIGDPVYSAQNAQVATNLGITKKRSKNAAAIPLEANYIDDVMLRYFDDVTLYKHFAEPVRNFQRIWNARTDGSASGVSTIRIAANTLWNKTEQYYSELLADLQGRGGGKIDRFTRTMNKALSHFSSAVLGLNPRVMLSQNASYFVALAYISPINLLKGRANLFLKLKGKIGSIETARKYSVEMAVRNQENSYVQGETLQNNAFDLSNKKGKIERGLDKVGNALTKGDVAEDYLTVDSLWVACMYQVQHDTGYKLGTEENLKAAGELCDKVIRETQLTAQESDRSALQRSKNPLAKTFALMSSASMKMISLTARATQRLIITTKFYKAGIGSKADVKNARGFFARAVTGVIVSNVAISFVRALFNAFRKREKDKDKAFWQMWGEEFLRASFGIYPFVGEIYDFVESAIRKSSNELEAPQFTVVNDLMSSLTAFAKTDYDDPKSIRNTVRNLIFSVAQFTGLPVKNAYSYIDSAMKWIFPDTEYILESKFTGGQYSTALRKALEDGDEDRANLIAGLMLDDKGIKSSIRNELIDLTTKGYSVLPRTIGDTITYDGETYTLTKSQKTRFQKIYGQSTDAVQKVVSLQSYKKLDDAVKAKTIKRIYDMYYGLAIDDLLGTDTEDKTVLFANAVDPDKLALIISQAQALEADKDKNGNTIAGSKKKKVQAYINGLNITAVQKYMIMGYLGYKNTNGKAQVQAYINRLNLSKKEKETLLHYSGY